MSATKDQQEWASISEEKLFFDEVLTHIKYETLNNTEAAQPPQPEAPQTDQQRQAGDRLAGLVDAGRADEIKSVQLWLKDLAYSAPDPTLFEAVIKKRATVQRFLAESRVEPKEKKASLRQTRPLVSQTRWEFGPEPKPSVPLVVRLSVLTMFPLIESLSEVKDFNYAHLCSQTLGVVAEVMRTIPPSSLSKEPADCLEAFAKFTLNLLQRFQYKMDTLEARQAFIAFFGLSISRGGGKDILKLTELLFNVFNAGASSIPSDAAHFLGQFWNFQKTPNVLIPSFKTELKPISLGLPIQGKQPSSMAIDGTFIYFTLAQYGVVKVGTGLKNTVGGHVYASFQEDFKGQPSLALVQDTLYVFSFEGGNLSQPGSYETQGKLLFLSAHSLEKVGETNLALSGKLPFKLLSDGKSLFLIGRAKESAQAGPLKVKPRQSSSESNDDSASGDSKSEDDSEKPTKTTNIVDIFNPLHFSDATIIRPSRTFELNDIARSPKTATFDTSRLLDAYVAREYSRELPVGQNRIFFDRPQKSLRRPEPKVQHEQESEFYIHGDVLVCLSAGSPFPSAMVHTFSIASGKVDGKYSLDHNFSYGALITYCTTTRRVWAYDNQLSQLKSWADFSSSSETQPSILSSETLEKEFREHNASEQEMHPLIAIAHTLANMDRVLRQHVAYHYPTLTTPQENQQLENPSPSDPSVLEFLFLNINHSLDLLKKDQHGGYQNYLHYILLTCVRLLKVHLHLFIVNSNNFSKDFQKAGFQDGGKQFIRSLRALTFDFVNNVYSNLIPDSYTHLLQTEASNALTVGFLLFCETPSSQLEFLTQLLQSKAAGSRILLNQLFESLSEWNNVASILATETPADAQKQTEKDSKGNSPEGSKKPRRCLKKQLSPHSSSFQFLELLVDFLVQEAQDKLISEPSVSPLSSSGIRFLLSAQRQIMANVFGTKFLVYYTTMILEKSNALLQSLSSNKALFERTNGTSCLFDCFRDTLVGVIMGTLGTSLCQKSLSKKPDVVFQVLGPIFAISKSYDSINAQITSAQEANEAFLKHVGSEPEKRITLEVKTQPHHSLDVRQTETATIRGAKALAIYFDLAPTHDFIVEITNPLNFRQQYLGVSPIIVPGDTLSVSLSQSPDLHHLGQNFQKPVFGSCQVAGVKCSITPALSSLDFQPVIGYWSLDIEASFAWCAARCSAFLSVGDPLSDQEKRYSMWESSGIFGGGLEDFQTAHPEYAAWIAAFLDESTQEVQQFWKWLRSQSSGRPKNTHQPTEYAERHLIAVYIKYFGLLDDAIRFSKSISNPPAELIPFFQFLSHKSWRFGSWLLRRISILKEWQNFVYEQIEKNGSDSGETTGENSINEYVKSLECSGYIEDICHLKNLPIDPTKAFQLITEKLQEEITQPANSDNLAEIVTKPSVERLRFLLFKVASAIGSNSVKHLFPSTKTTVKTHPSAQSSFGTSHTWKKWHCFDSLDNTYNPTQSILLFAQYSAPPHFLKDIEKLFAVQEARAKSRIKGFEYFHRLSKLSEMAAVRHQIFGSSNYQLHHYLAGLASVGKAIQTTVTESFTALLCDAVDIFSDPKADPLVRCLTIRSSAMLYEDYDFSLLLKSNLLPALQSVISKESKEQKSQFNPRQSAWIAFRLLATLCLGWNQNDVGSESVYALQHQAFDVMCFELGRISKDHKSVQAKEISNQTFELLSLLVSFGSNEKRLTFLSEEPIKNILSMLGGSISPRSQRLALRLCRKLLPAIQNSDSVNNLIQSFLKSTGELIFGGIVRAREKLPEPEPELEPAIPGERKLDQSSASGDYLDENYCLNLLGSDGDAKKLAGLCQVTLGSLPSESMDANATKALQELATKGFATLMKGPQQQCHRLAKAIGRSGLSVITTEKGSQQINHDQSSQFWLNHQNSLELASEYIALFRELLQNRELVWFKLISEHLVRNIQSLSQLMESFDPSSVFPILASLSILGSFEEIIRVGGTVECVFPSGKIRCTVVENRHSKFYVAVDSDESKRKTIQRISSHNSIPVSEYEANPSLFEGIFDSIIPPILQCITNSCVGFTGTFVPQLFRLEVERSCLRILTQFSSTPQVAALLRQDKQKLCTLLDMSKDCQSRDINELTDEFAQLKRRLVDVVTCPASLQFVSPMRKVLPFYPNSGKVGILPTGFDSSHSGIMFWGESRRVVECTDLVILPAPPPTHSFTLARPALSNPVKPTEILILGNAPLPLHVECYFEVEVIATPTSNISVGLSPEGSPHWGIGSYRYQANKEKLWYNISGRESKHAYGQSYTSGDIIGLGWNPETKAIYFTKNGTLLDSWNITPNQKLFPAVGIAKGAKVKINFGQEPFKFKFQVNDEIDPQIIIQKQKEALLQQNEALLKLKIEIAEKEREARKKREDAIAQVVDMGFTEEEALEAMETMNYDGDIQRLVGQILNDRDHPRVSKPKKTEMPAPPPVETADPVEEANKEATPESRYRADAANFFLSQNCFFKATHEEDRPHSDYGPLIQEMKDIMAQDYHRDSYQINEAVSQFTYALNHKQIAEATDLFLHFCGRLPSQSLKTKPELQQTTLRINTVAIGSSLRVNSQPQTETCKLCGPEPANVLGKNGTVKKVDLQNNLVLLSFYEHEDGLLQELWFPLSRLCQPTTTPSTDNFSTQADIENQLLQLSAKIASFHSRALLINLLSTSSFSQNPDSAFYYVPMMKLELDQFLPLAESFTSPAILIKNQKPELNAFSHKLKEFYHSLPRNSKQEMVSALWKECSNALAKSSKLLESACTINEKSTEDNANVPDCDALVITFDRSTNLHSGSQVQFYSNKQCTDLTHTFTERNISCPFLFSGTKLYFRFINKAQTIAHNIFKFTVSPISKDILLARWIMEFLVFFANVPRDIFSDFLNRSLDFLYSWKTPTVCQESYLNFFARICFDFGKTISEKQLVQIIPLTRLEKLKQEMITLNDFESRQGIHSSYFQSLVELFVALKLLKLPPHSRKQSHKETPEKPTPNPKELGKTPSKEELAQLLPTDEGLSGEPAFKFAEQDEASELRQAIQMSVEHSQNPPKAPPSPSPRWVHKLARVMAILEILNPKEISGRPRLDMYIIKKAWNCLRKEPIFDKTILVSGLPIVPEAQAPLFSSWLIDTLGEFASIVPGSLFHPIWEGKTLPWCALRLHTKTGVDDMLSPKLPNKLKLPASIKSDSKKTFQIVVKRHSEDERFGEYASSFLIKQHGKVELTPKCLEAVTEIFGEIVGSKDGVFTSTHFHFAPKANEQSKFNQLLKQSIEESSLGLKLTEFISFFTKQCSDNPLSAFAQLSCFGYDQTLQRHFLPHEDLAIRSITEQPSKANLDSQIVGYVESYLSEHRLHSALQLSSDILYFPAGSSAALRYPLLAQVPTHILRLRFELLKQLNRKDTFDVLPYVNLERDGFLTTALRKHKNLFFHSSKMEFVYNILGKTACPQNIQPPQVNINRLKIAANQQNQSKNGWLTCTSFGSALTQLKNTNPAAFRQKKPNDSSPHFSIKIEFQEEYVEGDGGPYRQFFTDISRELQSNLLPLFVKCPNGRSGVGNNLDKFVLVPTATSTEHRQMFKFLGQLMGMAIRTGTVLPLDLTPFFWKPLAGESPNINDLKGIDKPFANLLGDLNSHPERILGLEQKFEIELSDQTSRLLKPGGNNIPLTMENKDEWAKLALQERLNESRKTLSYLKEGLFEVIPETIIRFFTPKDLEWRISGEPNIDIKLLKRHTEYSSVSPTAPHIQYFWKVLESFSQQERRRFVQFAWAQERLPATDQEFARTSTRMLIKPHLGTSEPDKTFPKADTCFFNLTLPEYSSPGILRERLLTAIHTDSDSMNADQRSN